MTLEGAQGRIWCSEFSWQTVRCSWSIDGEAALSSSTYLLIALSNENVKWYFRTAVGPQSDVIQSNFAFRVGVDLHLHKVRILLISVKVITHICFVRSRRQMIFVVLEL